MEEQVLIDSKRLLERLKNLRSYKQNEIIAIQNQLSAISSTEGIIEQLATEAKQLAKQAKAQEAKAQDTKAFDEKRASHLSGHQTGTHHKGPDEETVDRVDRPKFKPSPGSY